MKYVSFVEFKSFNYNQKVNYIKNLLFNYEIEEALNHLLQIEKGNLEIIKIILKILEEDLIINRVKQQCNLQDNKYAKLYVYSKILSVLSFYNRQNLINNFFKLLNDNLIKDIAFYEYQNKTSVSFNSKIFNKYCFKYKEEVLTGSNLNKEDKLMFNTEIKKYKKLFNFKTKKYKIVTALITGLAIVITSITIYNVNKIMAFDKKYNNKIYPGIYINSINLKGKKVSELSKLLLNEKDKIKNGSIIITNINGDYKFSYDQMGIIIDNEKIEKEIKNYNNNLTIFNKIKILYGKKENKVFHMKGSFNEESIDGFVNLLKEKLDVKSRSDSMVVDENYNVYYDKGCNGFTLDVSKTKEIIKKELNNLKEESVIEVSGKTIKNEIKYASLSKINKKVSTYTTYFENKGNRGHNIVLAASKLNKTIVMPGQTFSYLKVVGPYGASNGYLPAPVYINGEVSTANGGGVCQLTSTLYNAQLMAGLQTVYRTNHIFAPNYVPKGLDATVYSTTTDYKFLNNYSQPIFITSYVKGNYLTVDIWSNENLLEGKTYEPYSVYSNGGYLAYLKISKDGKVIETKYLDKSYYKTH